MSPHCEFRRRLDRLFAQLRPVGVQSGAAEPPEDPYRVPVVVGVARITKGPAQGFPGTDAKVITSPVDICMEAVKAAAADSTAGDELLKRVKIMGWPNVNLGRETNDPCWLLEQKMGGVLKLDRRRGYYGGPGSSGQLYMNDFAYQLASGVIPKGGAALVAMGEARHSIRRMRRHTKEKGYKSQNAKQAAPELRAVQFPSPIRQGEEEQQRQENTHGLTTANYNYSLYENALRVSAGRTLAEHKAFIGEIFAKYSRVAKSTPQYSWFTNEFTPSEITTATPDNRMISGPFYTKQMCAFNDVDMGAAAILTSAGAAADLKIPKEKWVYLHGCASTEETQLIASRASYAESIQHYVGFREALAHAAQPPSRGAGSVAAVDIYSPYVCMPQLAARALGVPALPLAGELGGRHNHRGWSITGGHCFHGAPGAGYGVIAIAAMCNKMRELGTNGGLGLVNTNGGIITTQGFGVYGQSPPPPGWMRRWRSPKEYQVEIDNAPRPKFEVKPNGPCVLETYAVTYGHANAVPAGKGGNGANLAVIVGRLGVAGDGPRFVANSTGSYDDKGRFKSDEGPLKQLEEQDGWIGGACTVTTDDRGRNIVTLGTPLPY